MPWKRRGAGRTYRKPARKSSGRVSTRTTRTVKVFKSKYRPDPRYSLSSRNSIFNKEYYAKLKYQILINADTTAGSMFQYTLRLNSCYDPDFTQTGAQPLFYDTLCGASETNAPYNTYRVCGAKFKAFFININTGPTTAGQFFTHWRYGGAGQLDSAAELGTQPNTITKDVNSGYSPRGTTSMRAYVSMKKMMGIKDLKDDDDTAGAYNANPAKVVLLDIGYVPYEATTTDLWFRVKITYYVQFTRQNEMIES